MSLGINHLFIRRAVTIGLLATLLAGCGSEDQPGSPAVYSKIEAMTDCAELQATFDRNMDDTDRRSTSDPLRDVVFSYAKAADARMRELGCFD